MNDSTTVEWLSKAIAEATRSATFCVAGCLPAVDPGIEVEGLGPIRLPLKQTVAKELVARCSGRTLRKGNADAGQHERAKHVRTRSEEVSPGGEWNAAIADATRSVAEQLGLPAGTAGSQAVQAAGV